MVRTVNGSIKAKCISIDRENQRADPQDASYLRNERCCLPPYRTADKSDARETAERTGARLPQFLDAI